MTGSIRTTGDTTTGTRMDMCARTETNTKQRAFPHETRQTQNLLISWTLSHDACVVRVSDKTLFILRERISQARDGFQITTWHCRIHRLMCSPSNSQSRSGHRESDEQKREKRTDKKQRTKSACTALQKHTGNSGKTKPPRCAGSAHQPRTCLLDNKNRVPQDGYKRETVATQGRVCFRQFMFAVALRMHSKLFSSDVHNVSSN